MEVEPGSVHSIPGKFHEGSVVEELDGGGDELVASVLDGRLAVVALELSVPDRVQDVDVVEVQVAETADERTLASQTCMRDI